MASYNSKPAFRTASTGQYDNSSYYGKPQANQWSQGNYNPSSYSNGNSYQSHQKQSTEQVTEIKRKQAQRQALATDTYFRLLTEIDVLLNKCGFNNPIQFPQFNIVASADDVQGMLLDLDTLSISLSTYHKMAGRDGVTPPVYDKHAKFAQYYAKFIPGLPKTPEGQLVADALKHLIASFKAGEFSQPFDDKLSDRIMSKETKNKYANVETPEGVTLAIKTSNQAHEIITASEPQIEQNTREVLQRYQNGKQQMEDEFDETQEYPGGYHAPKVQTPTPLVNPNYIHNHKVKEHKKCGYPY